ncbi:MAG: helix-turn-helix domain-containing protein [Deltaproteobacteria bacterium]|nr:helix-turn-helix domain-containing protein [Deltaproteobacteria bacterium]
MDSKILKDKILLRPDEVAQVLRVSKYSIYRLIKEDRIRSVKVGGSMRIFSESVKMFLDLAD